MHRPWARPDQPRRRAKRLVLRVAAASGLVAGVIAGGCSGGAGRDHGIFEEATATTAAPPAEPELTARSEPLPVVTPTPRGARWLGPDVPVPGVVALRVGAGVDAATRDIVEQALRAGGARTITRGDGTEAGDDAGGGTDGGRASLTVAVGILGGLDAEAGTRAAFRAVGVDVPPDLPAEGYVLTAYRAGDHGTL